MACFETLLKDVHDCRLCEKHLPLGPRPVVQMHPNAKILIAGQAPGSVVHASGVSFDDASGHRLRTWMGVDRKTFYDAQKIALLPMGFCYPGRGSSGDLPPRPECASTWREELLSHLPNIQLTLVLGQYAQSYHIKEKYSSLTELVRDWKSFWPQLLPLPHPSPRNNIWLKKNLWFTAEVLPRLTNKVKQLI